MGTDTGVVNLHKSVFVRPRFRVEFLPGIIYNIQISLFLHFKLLYHISSIFFYISYTNRCCRLNRQIEEKPNLNSTLTLQLLEFGLELGLIIQSLSTVDILKNGDSCRDTYFRKTLRHGSNNVSVRVGVRFPVKLLNHSKTQLVEAT